MKNNKEKEKREAQAFQKKLNDAKAKGGKDSIHNQVKGVIDDEGSNVFKFIGS